MPGHPFDWRGPLPCRGLGGSKHRCRHCIEDVVLVDEAHFHVELHELVLAVSAQVFVTEAARHLVVAVDSGHHEELFEELRRLRQRIEGAGLLARRHEEFAGALGRRRDQHRRLDLDEVLDVHGVTNSGVDLRAQTQVLLHPLATQVEVAVLEPDVLVDVVGASIDRERRRRGAAQDLHLAVANLDPAGRERIVDGALGPFTNRAGEPEHVLAAHVDVVVDDALHDA